MLAKHVPAAWKSYLVQGKHPSILLPQLTYKEIQGVQCRLCQLMVAGVVMCTLSKSAKMNLTDGGGCGNSLNWERLSMGFLEVAVTGNLAVVRWQDLPVPC